MSLLLISCITLLLGLNDLQAAIWNQKPQDFIKGKVYEFQYSSQALSGLPKTSSEYMGLQMTSLVELFFESNTSVIMTLKKTEILESIKPIRTSNPDFHIDQSYFKKFKDINRETMKTLHYPVKFKWKFGQKVNGFKTMPGDEMFSINIKRGVINMLNMKFGLSDSNWKADGGSYVVFDDEGIDGVCEANYIWHSYPFVNQDSKSEKVRTVSITRIKSANRCRVPRGYEVANFVPFINPRQRIDLNRTLVKNENVASMNFSIWKSGRFFMWEAQSQSRYSIEPMNHLEESVTTVEIQSLRFHQIIANPNRPRDPGQLKSVMMGLDKRFVPLSKIEKKKIQSLVLKLDRPDENTIPDLIQLLRRAEYSDINEISTKATKSPNLKQRYLHILAQVHTVSSTKAILNDFLLKPKSDINDDWAMARLVDPLAGIASVEDTRLINLLMVSINNKILRGHQHRYNTLKTCILTLGSLIGRHFSQNPSYDIKKAIKYFASTILTRNSTLGQAETAIIVLKAIGNIGAIESLPYLTKLITDKTQPTANRAQAIHSLRKIARLDAAVELILLSTFSDVGEDVEIRLGAAVDILLRHTKSSTLNALSSLLAPEPINQVKAYLQDFIVIGSKLEPMKSTFEPLLKKLTISDYSDEYSRIFSIPFDKGIAFVSVIFTPDSGLPRVGSVIIYNNLFGKLFQTLELGFRIEKSKSNFRNLPLTFFYKSFDNDVGYFPYNDKTMKAVGLGPFAELLNGKRAINLKYFTKMLLTGELFLPTTIGLTYSTRVLSTLDIQLVITGLNDRAGNIKFTIQPRIAFDTLAEVGIDSAIIKSEINSRFHVSTPNPVLISVGINLKKRSISIGMMKPLRDHHVLILTLEKRFKITNNIDHNSGAVQFFVLSRFYVEKSDLKRLKTQHYRFPFNRYLACYFFFDTGKPQTDGIDFSPLSAGDVGLDVWLKRKSTFLGSKSAVKFNEIALEMRYEANREYNKLVFAVTHIMDDSVVSRIDLARATRNFPQSLSIGMAWPEKTEDVWNVIKLYDRNPKINFLNCILSMQLPDRMKFDKNEPLKLLSDRKEYSYRLSGIVKNSRKKTLYSLEIDLSTDPEAKQLREAIIKKPRRYAAHDSILQRCSEDIDRKMPNSPSCFQSWMKLNNHNQLSISLTWFKESHTDFLTLYNVFSKQSVVPETFLFNPKINTLRYTNIVSPYFSSSAISSINFATFTSNYKTNEYRRDYSVNSVIARLNSLERTLDRSKSCHIVLGLNEIKFVKTFDGYFYNTKSLRRSFKPNDAERMVFVQDERNLFQISEIRTATKLVIQIIGKDIPQIRIIRDRGAVDMYIDNQVVNDSLSLRKNVFLFRHGPGSIFNSNPAFEVFVESLQIRILTDMEEIIYLMVGNSYHSTLRGICGDMDGEVYNEFKNANCTGIYESPGDLFLKSDYKREYKGFEMKYNIVTFIPIRACSKNPRLLLL